ncbi:hypothetical protein P691DRAFT_790648 [Macrolepiota fuliginosa MF-IS2]|uniref:Uncharacterized protein n=1 Tax=Macrolepiota fuliginosa MF-IS2 TaxID=1400762 RepID=A0A9P5WZC1_9AGAR|nr:hypothetical protein P691DRAFT_790648 [Macrolepiota fuliginosa MF-IS2]
MTTISIVVVECNSGSIGEETCQLDYPIDKQGTSIAQITVQYGSMVMQDLNIAPGKQMLAKEVKSVIDNDLYSLEKKLKLIFEAHGVNKGWCNKLFTYTKELAADTLSLMTINSKGINYLTYKFITLWNLNKLTGRYAELKDDPYYKDCCGVPMNLIYRQLPSPLFKSYI